MGTWESNGHVTDDVHVTLKVQGREPNMLRAQYLKTAGDTDFSAMEHLSYTGHGESNGVWQVE